LGLTITGSNGMRAVVIDFTVYAVLGLDID